MASAHLCASTGRHSTSGASPPRWTLYFKRHLSSLNGLLLTFACEGIGVTCPRCQGPQRGDRGLTHNILAPGPPSLPLPLQASLPFLPDSRPWAALIREVQGRPGARRRMTGRGWDRSRARCPQGSLGRPGLFGLGGLAPEASSWGDGGINSCTELMRPHF